MAFKTALVLLSIALAVSATNVSEDDPLHQKLNGDLNSVCNQLLGVPCKVSPPPPTPAGPPGAPPTEPPTVPPTEPPTLPPAPLAADGIATGQVEITLPGAETLTDAEVAAILALIQGAIGSNGVITLSPTGRKLLASQTITFTVTGVKSCALLIETLNTYVQSGELKAAANAEGIDVVVATLVTALCAGPDAGVGSISNSPPTAPTPGRR